MSANLVLIKTNEYFEKVNELLFDFFFEKYCKKKDVGTIYFIKKAVKKYGKKYHYVKTLYTGDKENVIITCFIHGDFTLTAKNFIYKRGCIPCEKKIQTLEFIKKAKKKYGDKYNYEKTRYENEKENIIITCPFHKHDFQYLPKEFLAGEECCYCKKNTKTLDFIERSIKIHGDKYDYSLTYLYNNRDDVIIICIYHNKKFIQINSSHTQGKGCFDCGRKNIAITRINNNKEIFQERAKRVHGDRYVIEHIVYTKIEDIIKPRCDKHGEFSVVCNYFLNAGRGCPFCSKTRKLCVEEVIRRANIKHNNKYDYSLVKEYQNNRTKIPIKCPDHGIFHQPTIQHINMGNGCPNCGKRSESKLCEFLKRYYNVQTQVKFNWCINEKTNCKRSFDFLLTDFNIIIEMDGFQHFIEAPFWKSSLENRQNIDIYKMKKVNEHGYSVLRILQEDVWYDRNNWQERLLKELYILISENLVQNTFICDNNEYNIYKEKILLIKN